MPLRWRILAKLETQPEQARELGVDPIVAQILATRGYDTAAAAREFLDAPVGALTDPDRLIDASRAADRIAAAVRGGDLITVYGDYDADGVSATAILLRGLTALGGQTAFYIPSRFTEGYGLNDAALTRIAESGGRLVVTVDCGIGAVSEIARAAARGQEIIVVDHHLPSAALPAAYAIVDPKRPEALSAAEGPDAPPIFADYCAAGLAFQVLRAVRSRLGHSDLPEEVLDLAALGTIADVVPLTGDNRILARWGLAKMSSAPTLGLAALIRAAELSGPVTARHVSFSLAPRINAAGRLGDASVAVRLLTTDDPAEAETLAAGLDAENRRRQALNEQILAEAVEQVESRKMAGEPAIVLSSAGWHAGVIGIVASHLVERYYRPVVMIAVDGGVGKGSGRSITGLHLVDTLSECGDLLERFGGHAMAAGLTIDAARIDEFGKRFTEAAGSRLTPEALVPTLQIDTEVTLGAVTEVLAGQLERLAPFGAGNPEPVLAVRGVRAVTTRVLGDGLHLKMGVTDGTAYGEAIGFRLGDASELLAFTQAELDLAFSVALDRWDDKPRVQLVVRDLQTPGVDLDAVLMDGGLLIDRLFARAGDYLADGALGIEDAAAFYTKVAGVSYDNRQATVGALAAGDPLVLTREPDNAHDPHAIRVSTTAGEQVGYLSARVAARLAPLADAGDRYTATVSQVTGGGDRHYGLNVYIRRVERWTADDHPGAAVRAALSTVGTDELVERLRLHLLRGRRLRTAQLQAIHTVLDGRPVHAVFGPGKARTSVIAMCAAAAAIRGFTLNPRVASGSGRHPVVIALPLQSQVDRLDERFGPRLRQIGIRCVRAHGGLLFRQRQRLLEALHDGSTDVVIASHAYLVQHPVPAALLLADSEPTIGANLIPVLLERSGGVQVVLFSSAEGPEQSLASRGAEGPERAPASRRAAAPGGMDVVVDPFVRVGVRLSDRRGIADRLAVCAEVAGRGEKAMVFVSSRSEAVQLAQQLRGERSGETEIAYYHGGLPLRVREVLEQMYADGSIRVLVAADGFSEDVAPSDVRQVVLAGLSEDTATLAGQLGLGGLDGRQATVTLAYRREDVQVLRAQLAERHPPRDVLAAVYRAVRELSAAGAPVTWPDDPLLNALGAPAISRRTVGIGLDILAEAGVLQREFDGQRWRVSLPPDAVRRELATSLRYTEGQREHAALDAVEQWAFGPLSEILRAVAGPGLRAADATDARNA